MIAAQDLRIGNWLLLENTITHKVTGEDIYAIDDSIHHNGRRILYAKPIPLTPEILGKCGFEKKDVKEDVTTYTKDGIAIFIHDRLPKLFIPHWDDEDGCLLGTYMEYLHQLQNGWQVWTGNEIEITL